jgi:hypothetical protein
MRAAASSPSSQQAAARTTAAMACVAWRSCQPRLLSVGVVLRAVLCCAERVCVERGCVVAVPRLWREHVAVACADDIWSSSNSNTE